MESGGGIRSNKEGIEELNEWLPVTSSRNAKWWYSAFHNVTAMVGAGVLGLPFATSQLGWGPGITIITLSWIITLYTLWQMVEMHEIVPGKRLDRYHELGQEAFGKKAGLWIVVPQQLMVEVGVNIVYMITGGKSLKKVYDILRPSDDIPSIRTTYFIMMFAAIQLVLSHLPNLNSISFVSFLAATMSLARIGWMIWRISHNLETLLNGMILCSTVGTTNCLMTVRPSIIGVSRVSSSILVGMKTT